MAGVLQAVLPGMIGGAIGGAALYPFLIRSRRKLREQGRAVIGVQLVEGYIAGLGPKPKVGKWTIGTGLLTLGAIVIPITRVEMSQRRLSFRESHQVGPKSIAVIAESHYGRLEIFAPESDIEWITTALRSDIRDLQA